MGASPFARLSVYDLAMTKRVAFHFCRRNSHGYRLGTLMKTTHRDMIRKLIKALTEAGKSVPDPAASRKYQEIANEAAQRHGAA
jgi:hypothetical protein